ncbi:hypothetical protein V1227_37030 [Lentzea sp. DG1S-22]|uniref:hypothetical protein n=1 Tax=Lentzea sp. DG1S-22 TaxID=3108822 RepID=UPI002E77B1D6|nr:hypothetical protein [Lentzea sp. DG1S-22]WVH80536.1 hypothetical protein V1227_37030 [Lentzea sp. DG1S-22]
MRALWTAGGSAVLGSALLGVLVGMAIHGVSADDPLSRTPDSTWVGSTSSTPPSTTEISTTVSSAPPSTSSTPPSTQPPPRKTTPPPAVTNQEQPPPPQPTATTTAPSSSGWPCSPLNPLPPPTCKNMG